MSTVSGDRIQLGESHFHTFAAHTAFAELRRTDPVHLYRPLDTWILTKYHDIRAVSRDSRRFSAARSPARQLIISADACLPAAAEAHSRSVAPAGRFRAAVDAAQIGSFGGIPHVTAPIIEKYITNLELLGLL